MQFDTSPFDITHVPPFDPTKPIQYCGTTDEITSEDFPSCEFAYCSFVFAILTGFSIGAITLSNIIGIAYINKKASLSWLLIMTCFFEGLGMMTMSRYTLRQTITKTIKFDAITNLRLGFIVLGSTQMCSALILVNVLIFALPMSTTQVVISGLTGVSFIFFSAIGADVFWFIEELCMWMLCPLLGICMAWCAHELLKKHIFNHKEARKRVILFLPYQMTLSFYLMFGTAVSKIYIHQFTGGLRDYSTEQKISFAALMIGFPILMHPISRYHLLRKARASKYVKQKQQTVKEIIDPDKLRTYSDQQKVNTTFNEVKNRIAPQSTDSSSSDSEDSQSEQLHKTYEKFKAETHYVQDIKDAIKVWSHEPLLKAYFSRGLKDDYDKYELQDMERLRNRKARLITSKSYLQRPNHANMRELSRTQLERKSEKRTGSLNDYSKDDSREHRFKSVAVDYLEVPIVRSKDLDKAESAPQYESFMRADSMGSSRLQSEEGSAADFEEFQSYNQRIANQEIAQKHAQKADRRKLEREYRNRQRVILHNKIDKMFEQPLLISVCMLAMAHGSNEINVAAPLTAEIFLLDSNHSQIPSYQQYLSITVGLVSVLLGNILLGQRLLYKQRSKFMKTTISNGFIANTCVSIMLFVASSLNFTISSTYILMPCLLMLKKKESGKKVNPYKTMKAVIFAVFITVFSMAISVSMSWTLLYLDYKGPHHNQNDAYYRNNTDSIEPNLRVFYEL